MLQSQFSKDFIKGFKYGSVVGLIIGTVVAVKFTFSQDIDVSNLFKDLLILLEDISIELLFMIGFGTLGGISAVITGALITSFRQRKR